MTLGLALSIVLGFLVIILGLVTYHLTTRLSAIESAVAGGLDAPTRPLTQVEYADRFARAAGRARFAQELGDGISLFFAGDAGPDSQVLDVVANLATGRGVTLVFAGDRPTPRWPSDITVRDELGALFEAAGIVATPYGMVIREGRVVDAQLLGSSAALMALLGAPGTAQPSLQQTPLEVE